MQKFHPDCEINLCILAHGKPAKFSWSASFVIPDNRQIISAEKFCGVMDRERVERSALLFTLKQAALLKREKVVVSANFPLEGMLEAPSGKKMNRGSPDAEAILKEWSGFRFRKIGELSAEILQALKARAEALY